MGFFEELKVRFSGEDGLSGMLGKITGGMGGATKGGLAMGAAFAVVQMAIQAVMKAIQAMIKFVQEGIQAYVEFEKGIAEVSTLLSDKSPLEGYSEGLRQLAKDSGESLGTLTKGLYQVISASVDAGAAMGVLTVANRAAIAGVSDTATAVDVITSIMNAYGMSAAEAEKISDQLFTAVKYGKTTFGELAAGVGPIITMSANLGIGFDEVAASLATMTRSGIKTTNAVTYLRGVLQGVIKPSTTAIATAKELGVQFDQTALKSKGLGGFLNYLSEAAEGDSKVMAKLFPNVRAIQAVMALAGDNAQGFADDLDNMTQSAGATDAAFTTMADTTAFKLGQMKAEIADTQLEIGEKMIPATLAWSKVQVVLAETMGTVMQVIGKLYDMIVGPFVEAFSSINTSLGGTTSMFEILGKAIMFYWAATFKPLYTFIANVLAGAFEILGDTISVITDIFESMFGEIGPGVDIFELLNASLDAACTIIKNVVKTAFVPFKIALAVIKTVVLIVIQKFKDFLAVIKPVTDFLTEKLKPILDAISATFGVVKNAVGGFTDGLKSAWGALTNWSEEVIHGKETVDELGNVVNHTADEITDFAADIATTVRAIGDYDDAIETAVQEVKDLEEANKDLVSQIADLTRIDEITSSLDYFKKSSKNATYATQIFDDELRNAQMELLKTQGLLDGMNETLDEYGDTQKKNNLAIMKIRYQAKKEGRDLTEDEENQIGDLELANEGLRIKVQEEQIRMDDIQETALRTGKENVAERIKQLEDEKDAIKGKAKTEVEKVQEEIDANNVAILDKTLALNKFAVDRQAAVDKLNNELLSKQSIFNSDELTSIETQSGLKLTEIDTFITDSESKWRNHYAYLSGLAGGEVPSGGATTNPPTPTPTPTPPPPPPPPYNGGTDDDPDEPTPTTSYQVASAYGVDTGRTMKANLKSTSGVMRTLTELPYSATTRSMIATVIRNILARFPVGQGLSWESGGYIPSDAYGKVHAGEYVLPKKIVSLLDSLVQNPSSVGDRKQPSHIIDGGDRSVRNINIYGNINLPSVQNVDDFMRELQRRSRTAGARR